MNRYLPYGASLLVLLCWMALQGHAQAVSPRTGEAPKTGPQTLTLEEFNRLPNEVQVIMKQHPDRFIIDQQPKAVAIPLEGQGKAASTPEIQPTALPEQPKAKAPDIAKPVTPVLPDHPQQQRP